jgi:hypothetical protein
MPASVKYLTLIAQIDLSAMAEMAVAALDR